MAFDLTRLIERAFFYDRPLRNATESIARARAAFAALTQGDGASFEVVAPLDADEAWVHRDLLQPLVYFCESEGRTLPRCPGVFLSLFVDDALYCIGAAEVIAWAGDALGLTADELRARYGTHELETSLR